MTVRLFLQCFGTCCFSAVMIGYIVFFLQDYIKTNIKDTILSILTSVFKLLAIAFLGFMIYAIWFIR